MKKLCLASVLLLALPLAACSDDDATGDDDTSNGPDASVPVVDSGTGADADYGDWLPLVEADWSLPKMTEDYVCVIKTIPQDMYIKAFKPLIPTGTHHTVLTIYDGAKADSTYPCGAGENGQSMIYGSGVGSPEFAFPTGVAVRLHAGQKILLNLHLFNTDEAALAGHSGILVQTTDAASVQNEAEVVLAGPVSLNIPAGQQTVASGTCHISNVTSSVPIHVFAISSHMHQLGTHLKSTVNSGGTNTVIQDTDYQFDSQSFSYKDPMVTLNPGDILTTECTYNNTTQADVHWGQSSTQEMCFTDIFYYPAQGATFICPY